MTNCYSNCESCINNEDPSRNFICAVCNGKLFIPKKTPDIDMEKERLKLQIEEQSLQFEIERQNAQKCITKLLEKIDILERQQAARRSYLYELVWDVIRCGISERSQERIKNMFTKEEADKVISHQKKVFAYIEDMEKKEDERSSYKITYSQSPVKNATIKARNEQEAIKALAHEQMGIQIIKIEKV